jgi:hypothetical protein
MISDETLARAVTEGIISETQAASLRKLQGPTLPPPGMDAWAATPPSPDEESLRFITGFADIFVAVGLFLFLGAAGYFLQHFSGNNVILGIGLAVLAWLLAEFFTWQRRLALPSIILLGVFAVSVFASVGEAVSGPGSESFAIAIDRRALLVSGLTYAGIAFGTLRRQSGFSDLLIPSTLLALGAFVLLLSAGWRPLRRAVLHLFPAPLARRLPPATA